MLSPQQLLNTYSFFLLYHQYELSVPRALLRIQWKPIKERGGLQLHSHLINSSWFFAVSTESQRSDRSGITDSRILGSGRAAKKNPSALGVQEWENREAATTYPIQVLWYQRESRHKTGDPEQTKQSPRTKGSKSRWQKKEQTEEWQVPSDKTLGCSVCQSAVSGTKM